jgi:hypothetical protein
VSDEITPAVLRAAIEEANVRIPRPQALLELAGQTELLRCCFVQGSLIAKEAQAKVEKCLEDLLRYLPEIIKTNNDMLAFHRTHHDPAEQMYAQQQHLIQLRQAAQNVMNNGIGWAVSPTIEMWHDFVVQVAGDIRAIFNAMEPPVETGYTDNGPVTRVLVRIILLITGETPNGSTVNRFLMRERDNGNTTMMPASRIAHHFYRPNGG